jgi:Transposase IS66 family
VVDQSVDGYAGFGPLVKATANDAPWLAFCWAHARRKFYDIHAATPSPLATESLRRIAAVYEIEADIRGQPAEQRRAVRVIALAVLWRLRYRLTLRDLSEMFLQRGITFSHEAVRE